MAKTYDARQIESGRLCLRDGDDCFLLEYPPKRRMTDVSKLIWDFKENQPQAIEAMLEILLPQLYKWEKRLRDKDRCRYIVTIPGHARGKINLACETVAKTLGGTFPWLQHLPGALRRIKSVAKASYAGSYGERPKYDDHIQSIRYSSTKVSTGEGVLMMDDVFTTSETSAACRDILLKASGCGTVVGLFMGRTQND
jgi:predicted amidophosphoribosyltransferase